MQPGLRITELDYCNHAAYNTFLSQDDSRGNGPNAADTMEVGEKVIAIILGEKLL